MKLDFQLKEGKQDKSLLPVGARATEGLNQVFRVELLLSAKSGTLDPSDYLGKKAEFKVLDPISRATLAEWIGLVFRFTRGRETWSGDGFFAYRAVMRPSLWKLAFSQKSRVFTNVKKIEAIKKTLSDGHITGYQVEPLNNQGAHPQMEQVVQYQETDLDFVLRNLRGIGLNYFYLPMGDQFDFSSVSDPADYFRITDQPPSLKEQNKPLSLIYQPATGLVTKKPHLDYLGWESVTIPQTVSVTTHKSSDSFQAYATTNQKRDVQGGVIGGVFLTEDTAARNQENANWTPQDFADKRTSILAEELTGWSKSKNGTSNDLRVRPSTLITLAPDPFTEDGNSGNAQYLISQVDHRWEMGHRSKGDAEYMNSFQMVDKGSPLHPPCITHWPPKPS